MPACRLPMAGPSPKPASAMALLALSFQYVRLIHLYETSRAIWLPDTVALVSTLELF